MTDVEKGAMPSSQHRFPDELGALVDTRRCPACFAAITASPCTACGLELSDPRMARVLDLSRRIVALVDERADTLSVIRADAENARAAMAEPAPVVEPAPVAESAPTAEPAPMAPGSVAPAPAPAYDSRADAGSSGALTASAAGSASGRPAFPAPVSPPWVAQPGAESPSVAAAVDDASGAVAAVSPTAGTAPRRSSVQVFLLSVGVVLLAVAAAFFLTVAWINGGLVLRSVVIGVATAAVIATASVLRRRGLGSTAEGIALLGIALVSLDVWAVRANDLGGAASVDDRIYWGATALLVGSAFIGWARLSRLRAPLSAAVVALASGPALIVSGVIDTDPLLSAYAGGLALVIVALAAPLTPRLAGPGRSTLIVEIAVVRGVAALGVLVALASALFVDPGNTATPVLLTTPLALAVAAHAWALARRASARLAPVAATVAVLVFGVGVAATAARAADPTVSTTVPLLVAVAVALSLDLGARRSAVGVGRTTLTVAALTACVGAGAAALVPLAWTVTAFVEPLLDVFPFFARTALSTAVVDAGSTAAVITFAAVVVLAAVAWRFSDGGPTRRRSVLVAAAVAGILAGPQMRVTILIVLWYLVLAIGAIALLRRGRAERTLIAVTGGMALLLGGVLSFSSPLAWAVATVATLGVLWAMAGVHEGLRVPSSVLVVLFAAGSGLSLPTVLARGLDVTVVGLVAVTAVVVIAALCLALLVSPLAARAGLDQAQRAAGAATALAPLTLAGALAVFFRFEVAADVWTLVAALVAASATAALVVGRAYRSWPGVRSASAALFPLLLGGAATVAVRLLDGGAFARAIVLAALGVLVAAAALRALRADARERWIVDAGTAVVLTSAVAVASSEAARWLPLLLAAVAAILWATDAEGLFASRSVRRHLVWLALLLAALALWTRLSSVGTDAVEPFTLPVGIAVLAIAAGHERARRRVEGRSAVAPAVMAAAGTMVALVPTALADPDDLLRAVVVGVVSLAVLVAGAWLRPPRTPDVLPLAISGAAAVALTLLLGSRLLYALDRGSSGGGASDAVVLVVAVALAIAALGVARRSVAWAVPTARAVLLVAIAMFSAGEVVLLLVDGGPVARAVGAIMLLGIVGVGAARPAHSARRPASRAGEFLVGAARVDTPRADTPRAGASLVGAPLVGAALGGAAIVAAAGFVGGVRPLEWLTVPLALAFLATAFARSSAVTDAVTPIWLAGAGLALGLLPSAVLALDSLARAIGVMVVAVAVLLAVAVWRRLAAVVVPGIGVAGLALVVAGALRAVDALGDPRFDAWTLAAVAPLVLIAVVLARRSDVRPRVLAPAVAITALATAAALFAARIATTDDGGLRVGVTLVLILAVGSLWRAPHAEAVFRAAVGLSAGAGVLALVVGAANPIETATVPLGLALSVRGIVTLRHRPEARSWPALGPGLALVLVPSLLFDFSNDNTLWRVVAVGVVALVILLLGARHRLQAPVLLGGITLIVHAVAQLWPWITWVYGSVSGLWWLWLGIAGVLLIIVAATYERRIREVKAVALAIRALR